MLHHVPDINLALSEINRVLKKNKPFLIYLYYNLDNKPLYYKIIWKLSDIMRIFISGLPFKIKEYICLFIAISIYFPLAYLAKVIKFIGLKHEFIPLGFYHDKSFYVMKTDSLDRFGTRYENRYSKKEIKILLKKNGFKNIKFSNKEPYWHAIAIKK